MRAAVPVLLAVLLLAGCGGADEEAGEARTVDAVIETIDGDTVELTLEVADTPELRQRGLMGRESLPADHGMLFTFEEDTASGFWMKDTPLPLSIAFLDRHGGILAILDMEPCEADPCPVYEPEAIYRSALEVNRGAFERWGVGVGDELRVLDGS